MLQKILIAVLIPAGMFGAENDQWSNVQTLRRGDRIGVIQANHKRIEGQFNGAGDAGILIDAITVAKGDVVRVYRRQGMSRTKRALIGAAIGAVAGGVASASITARSNDEGWFGGDWAGAAAAVTAAGGAGVGAGIAALTGSGYKTIYQKSN